MAAKTNDPAATTGTALRESRVLDAPLLVFDTAAEATRLAEEPSLADHGRASRTLFKSARLRVVLAQLRNGARFGDDDGADALSIVVLDGTMRVTVGEAQEDLGPGQVAAIHGREWSLEARSESLIILTLGLPGGIDGDPSRPRPRPDA